MPWLESLVSESQSAWELARVPMELVGYERPTSRLKAAITARDKSCHDWRAKKDAPAPHADVGTHCQAVDTVYCA